MATTPGASVTLRIEGGRLPGRTFGAVLAPRHDNVHVGVQRRSAPRELLGLTPGDAPSASWTLECVARTGAAGVDLTGPYVQGRPGDRFVYLSWGQVDAPGPSSRAGRGGGEGSGEGPAENVGFTMFRRAKLMLGAVGADVLAAAVRSGRLTGRLALTDAGGGPLCARVVPPVITWSA